MNLCILYLAFFYIPIFANILSVSFSYLISFTFDSQEVMLHPSVPYAIYTKLLAKTRLCRQSDGMDVRPSSQPSSSMTSNMSSTQPSRQPSSQS